MSTSIISGLKVNIEKSSELDPDHWLIEVNECGSSFHAFCKLSVEGTAPKAETLSSDAPGDANRMDAWLAALSGSDLQTLLDAARVECQASDRIPVGSASAH